MSRVSRNPFALAFHSADDVSLRCRRALAGTPDPDIFELAQVYRALCQSAAGLQEARLDVALDIRPGDHTLPFWYGDARFTVQPGTRASFDIAISRGRVRRFEFAITPAAVLHNAVGSFVPWGIPGLDYLTRGHVSIDKCVMDGHGRLVPYGKLKVMFMPVRLESYVPRDCCPKLTLDAKRFFGGHVVDVYPDGSTPPPLAAVATSWLRPIARYQVSARFATPSRGGLHLPMTGGGAPLDITGTDVRGALACLRDTATSRDVFVSQPDEVHISALLGDKALTMTLVRPTLRGFPGREAHVSGKLEVRATADAAQSQETRLAVDIDAGCRVSMIPGRAALTDNIQRLR
jgi:hypothetical protein